MNREDYLKLLERYRKGDRLAADRLFEQLAVRLRTIVKHKVGWWSNQDQEDLVQSTLTVLVEKSHEIRENPCGYVVKVLNNRIGNEIQKRALRTGIPLTQDVSGGEVRLEGVLWYPEGIEPVSDLHADSGLEGRMELDRIIRAIDRLKPFCRAVFKGIIEDMAIGEIWEAIRRTEPALSRTAFDKRVFDCRKQLRLSLGNAA